MTTLPAIGAVHGLWVQAQVQAVALHGMMGPGVYTQITVLAGLVVVLIVPVLAVYAALRQSGNRTHVT